MNNPVNEKMRASHLYNQIIHSYIFLISTDESEAINGFFFCSVRMRNRKLYYIEFDELNKFITTVGNDYPVRQSFDYDEAIKDYKIDTHIESN
ncbi:hypothetical protein DP091_25985 [Paenibacillus sp. MDMC362]|nr:hypothetical protein DP091_25985 [Paenibacillus sp. MDMC362]